MPRPAVRDPGFRCRLCGSSRLRLFYTQGNQAEYRFFRCADCRLVNYDLAGGLDQEKYTRVRVSPLADAHPANRGATLTFRAVRRLVPPPARLLDLGCGNGRLLHLARQAGYEVQGHELSPELATAIRAELGVSVTAGDFLRGASAGAYDIVVLRHLLEHLPDPPAAAARVRELLKDGGYALLEFPNIDGLGPSWRRWLQRSGLHRRRFPAGYVPGHCHEYARASFKALLARTGLRLVSWRTYSLRPVHDAVYAMIPVGGQVRTVICRAEARRDRK